MNRLLMSLALFALLILIPLFAVAQITCFSFGTIVDCQGPSGQSQTQVPLGKNQGVIITDHDTMPYTIFPPSRSTFDPTPLPTPSPRYSTQPAPSQGQYYGIPDGSSSGMGAYGSQYGIILGQ